MRKKTISCLVVAFVVVFVANISRAQRNALFDKASKEKVPVVITAQQAEFDNKTRKAVYTGNVKVVRGDTTMYSDKLESFLDKEGKELDHIIATGCVKVLQGNKIITAEKGVYYDKEQKVVLTGSPVSRDGENVIEGSRMVYFFNQERVVVEDAKSVLHPDKKKNKKETVEPVEPQ